MDASPIYPSDVAFTPSVKAVQTRKGSRASYRRMEERGSWQTRITPELAGLIAAQTSVFLATASQDGQPYIQHRGGPPGFLHVLDEQTLGFADFAGNRQYITQGNLADNPKAHLFLIDYAHRRRVKLWGEARIVEGDAGLLAKLMPDGYKARPEQVILFTVAAWDANCPQHIPQRFEAAEVAAALAERDQRIAALEDEIRRLRAGASGPARCEARSMGDKLPRFEITPLSDDDGGGYLIEFPDYPGCMADGETPEAAIAEGRDALASYVATLRDLERPIPQATQELRKSWRHQIPVAIQSALTRRADAEGISLSALVARLLAEGLERRTDP